MKETIERAYLKVGALAGQIGKELGDLALEVDGLQGLLSEALCAAASPTRAEGDVRLVMQAQALDRASQSISQLSGILERIALQADPEWRLAATDLLDPVSLTALARRLSGAPEPAAPVDEDMELF